MRHLLPYPVESFALELMRRLYPLLVTVFALLLAGGCRDVLVDPSSPIPQAPPATGDVPSIYLKGPTSLPVNAEANYRAQLVAGVDHYEWRAMGDGEVSIRFPYGGDTRLPVVTGQGVGAVDLIAEAYDSDGRLIALAAKNVAIQ